MDWVQIGEGVCQGCILSLCLFNLYSEYIIQNVWLDKTQAEIKIAGRNIKNLRYADDTTLMAESEEELKSLLMKVKGRGESWLKTQQLKNQDHGIQSHQFMAIDGKQWQTVFWKVPKSLQMVTAAMKFKDAYSLEKKL